MLAAAILISFAMSALVAAHVPCFPPFTKPNNTLIYYNLRPLLLVAVLIFFAMSALVERYNFIYVFRRPFESGGRMWRQVGRPDSVAGKRTQSPIFV